jgi:predicted nucleic acid-binding protein
VALVDEIRPGAAIALDSDALIYYVEEDARFLHVVEPVMQSLILGQTRGHISTITLLEVLVKPFREGRSDIADMYRAILRSEEWLTLHPLTADIAERAASIRAAHRVEVADSIVAATALVSDCDFLLTNNGDDFRRVAGLTVQIINDYV